MEDKTLEENFGIRPAREWRKLVPASIVMRMKNIRLAAFFVGSSLTRCSQSRVLLSVLLACLCAAYAHARTVLLVSIDGLRPDYVTKADEHGLKVPNLRRMMKEGTYAEGVAGVTPTVTYPSHTTLITGVWPAQHGIYANTTFDPEQKNQQGWYWYSEDIKVMTLWDAARAAGLTTASVNWPVSVGAKINYLIPEVWRTGLADDQKLIRALATSGLLSGLEGELGPYPGPLQADLPGDRARAKFAIAILGKYKPNFMTVHLSSLDHIEHETGPFSAEANALMEGMDELIGQLQAAVLAADPEAVICVVSDHGFAPVTHRLNLAAAFVQQGLIKLSAAEGESSPRKVESWQAMPWISGGAVAIVLKDPHDEALRKKTEELLQRLAADPANGINRVVGSEELARLGGYPTASLLVDLKPGFQAEHDFTKPVHRDTKLGGTHGYLPEHPELRASFFIMGSTIGKSRDLGLIDMRQIAPTLAGLLGLNLPAAQAKPLNMGTP
jgi:predicted AlkP superfamily pyrophosphatase or phosphodiesterase